MSEKEIKQTEEIEAPQEEHAIAEPISYKGSKMPFVIIGVLVLGIISGMLGSFIFIKYIDNKNNTIFTGNTKVNVQESSAVIDVSKKVSPAVVSITGVTQQLNLFGNASTTKSAGTGFIVRADGLIVTNKHVVADTSTKYTVITSDGKQYNADIKSTDPINDIAILKIDGSNLPIVDLGNSDDLQVGQTAIAIGNALGQYQNSVTVGVVSGIGRVIQAGDSTGSSTESLDNVIQTDAAINPGNSGGPLINIAGQAIGVNTAVDSQAQGIGFAIPINLVKSALDSYLANGKIVRPMLGVRYVSLTKEISTQNNLSVSQGALIYSSDGTAAVVVGSPADKAGLKSGDIITKINDDAITEKSSLISLLSKYKPGDNVKVTYVRDGKEKSATVTLSANS